MMNRVLGAVREDMLSAVLFLSCLGCVASTARAQGAKPSIETESRACSIDLERPGTMKDIVSNALVRGLECRESDVRAFLRGAESEFTSGRELLRAAAANFAVSEADLTAEVQQFKHCNCQHGPAALGSGGNDPSQARGADPAIEPVRMSKFAEDVTLHVVLHELGHALIREFDLPVLGNEETMADAFATCYLTTYLPDRAVDVLEARTRSLMIEAKSVSRDEWSVSGEHNSDARRAFQIAALAVAADVEKFESVARSVGMSDRDITRGMDYGTEIHRSWRRVLKRLWMPDGVASREVRFELDSGDSVVDQLRSGGMIRELESAVRRFDWHSQITIHLAGGDGGAGWNRSKRTIKVHSGYIRRFIAQGAIAGSESPK